MSYGRRRFAEACLFRAVIHVTGTRTVWRHGEKVSETVNRTDTVGPYATPAPARAAITEAKRAYRNRELTVTGNVEEGAITWTPIP